MSDDVLKVRLSADGIQEVMDALKKAEGGTRKLGQAGKQATDALGSLGTLFAAQQIAAFTMHAIEATDALGKMGQKTGVAVEQLSVLAFMGQQADLSNQDLEKGLVKLSKSLTDLQAGAAPATEAFARLGLRAEDFKGLSLDQALLKVSNAQARFADGAGKADTMLGLLGKSGANMIPLMNDLANGGFENAKQKLQELGLVITGDMAKASQDFNDSMKRLELAAQGATVQIAQTMLPSLTGAVDALTGALAATPAGAKAMVGGFILIGSAATATAVAVRSLGAAFVALGPAGWAIVAVSALASGLIALQAAEDAEQASALKSIQDRGTLARQGKDLETAYRKEAEALQKSTGNKKEAAKHAAKLKEIEDQMVALSPEFQKTLKDETKGILEKADAWDKNWKSASKSLEMEKAEVEQSIKKKQADLEAAKADAAFAASSPRAFGVRGGMGGGVVNLRDQQFQEASVRAKGLENDIKKAQDRLDAIRKSLGEGAAAGTPGKPTITVDDAALKKSQAAEAAALAKRMADQQKAEIDAYSALTEDLYKQGLLDLTTYLAARRQAIVAGAQSEVKALQDQITAEEKARTKGMTSAERMASETKVGDLKAQIALKQEQAQQKLDALERIGRDEREKNAEEALKLEAELAAAKGQTGEAGIRAIEAEYARRIQLARTPEAKAALLGLQGTAMAKARVDDTQKSLDLGQRGLTAKLDQVDALRAQGQLTEEEALQRKMALYREYVPLLQAAADEQLRLAQLTHNQEDLIKARENANGVEQLKVNLKTLGDQMDWVKTTAKDAFEQGLGNLLATLTDQTTSLTDKVLALGQAIAQALLQQASMKIASAITTAIFKADGGYIQGPGTTTSDSIPAMLSDQEYVVRAAAVRKYGVGYLDALNGMRLPKGSLPAFADGGLVGSPAGGGLAALPAPRVRVIVVSNEREAMEALMNGPAGEQAVLQHIHRNPDALRG